MLENVSLLVLQIQGRPKEAISYPGTVDKTEGAELYNESRTRPLTDTTMLVLAMYKYFYIGELFFTT